MLFFLKNIAILSYRIWYYLLTAISIIILFVFLFTSVLRRAWYPIFFKIARVWAYMILIGMGFRPVIKKEFELKKGRSYMIVANHTSMIDIMLMLYITKYPVVFVGKKELTPSLLSNCLDLFNASGVKKVESIR